MQSMLRKVALCCVVANLSVHAEQSIFAQKPEPLAVQEEYVGPVPATISVANSLQLVFSIDPVSGSVAYRYRFDSPDELLRNPFVMAPADRPPLRIETSPGSSVAFVRAPLPDVLLIKDGVPSQPFHFLSIPKVRENVAMYIGGLDDQAHFYRDDKPGDFNVAGIKAVFVHPSKAQMACLVYDDTKEKEKHRQFQVLFNDQLGPKVRDVTHLRFLKENSIIYVAVEGTHERVYVDDQPSEPYDQVSDLTISPDGKRSMYIALRQGKEKNENSQWLVVVDGVEQPAYDGLFVNSLQFSPDGQHYAYAAERDNRSRVIVDGREHPAFDAVAAKKIQFSRDGKHVGYTALIKKRMHLVIDGKPGPPFQDVTINGDLFGEGNRICAVVRKGDKWGVLTQGEKPILFDEVNQCTFSPDGKRLAYAGRIGKDPAKWVVVVDGVSQDLEFDGVFNLSFSPDSRRIAYASRTGALSQAILDGEPVGPEYDELNRTEFSPDSQRFAVRGVRNRTEIIYLDDEPSMVHAFDEQMLVATEFSQFKNLYFSPDSNHLAYWAQHDDGFVLVCDRKPSAPYQRFVPEPLVWDSPNRVHGFALRDGELLRLHAGEMSQDDRKKLQASIAQWTDRAKAAEAAGDLRIAYALYCKGAYAGDPYCQGRTGRMNWRGEGTAKNEARGAVWTRKAAEKGDALGMSNLAILHRYGVEFGKDTQQARHWFERAFDAGFPKAGYYLGQMYQKGELGPKDETKARQWYLKAANKGVAEAQYAAGRIYDYVHGHQNYREAMNWYQKAADQKHPEATTSVGVMYAFGKGVIQDRNQANDWYRIAARLGEETARKNLVQSLFPDRRNNRGMYPWFQVERSTATHYGDDAKGEPQVYRSFDLEITTPGKAEPVKVQVPIYIYTAQELAAVDSDGVLHTYKLGGNTLDEFRPLDSEQWEKYKLTPTAMPICYPPYLCFIDSGGELSDQQRSTIQQQLEAIYENAAR